MLSSSSSIWRKVLISAPSLIVSSKFLAWLVNFTDIKSLRNIDGQKVTACMNDISSTCGHFGERKSCSSGRVFRADHETLKDARISKTNCPCGVRLIGQLFVALVGCHLFLQFLLVSLNEGTLLL